MIYKKDLRRFAKRYRISLVVLFGSSVRDRIKGTSNFDLAVWIKAKKIDEIELFNALAKFYQGKRIDLIVLNWSDPLTQYQVAYSGVPLYEDNKGAFNRFQVYAMKRNDDGKKFYNLDRGYIDRYVNGELSRERIRCYPSEIGKDGRIHWRTRANSKGQFWGINYFTRHTAERLMNLS